MNSNDHINMKKFIGWFLYRSMIFPIIYGDKSHVCHQSSIISHQPTIEGLWRQDAQTPATWVEIPYEFPMWDPKKIHRSWQNHWHINHMGSLVTDISLTDVNHYFDHYSWCFFFFNTINIRIPYINLYSWQNHWKHDMQMQASKNIRYDDWGSQWIG